MDDMDKMLDAARPVLAAVCRSRTDLSPERIEKLKAEMAAIHPFLRKLTAAQMKHLILSLLREKAMDGFELTSRLKRANFRLDKPGARDVAIYGILRQLESSGLVESERREVQREVVNVYIITQSGRAKLQKQPSKVTEAAAWVNAILAVKT